MLLNAWNHKYVSIKSYGFILVYQLVVISNKQAPICILVLCSKLNKYVVEIEFTFYQKRGIFCR